MITLRQMERVWDARQYAKLAGELMEMRIEAASPMLRQRLSGSTAAAALSLVRLDELDLAHVPFAQQLVRALLAAQSPADGGWEDPILTALCIRALTASHGDGAAVDRGMQYLADLQKSEGAWPREPIRRLAADPLATVFVLYQLGRTPAFQGAVRVHDAMTWCESNRHCMCHHATMLWGLVSTRSGGGLFRESRDTLALLS